jgi:nicotinamidase-related amidase
MGKAMSVHLFVIDPQNDFMDIPGATLGVPGASEDMKRFAKLVQRVGKHVDDIHVTLDSHRVIDVGHPGFWVDSKGNHPAPFTIISVDDIVNGIWTPRSQKYRTRMLNYAQALAVKGDNPLIVWPEHCIIGSPGHNVQADLFEALKEWERRECATVDYVAKGTNVFTEHYGALEAEVPDPEDPSTQLNTNLLEMLATADIIGLGGEALLHCLKSTLMQIIKNIGPEHVRKFQILTDCTSPVPLPDAVAAKAAGAAWLKDMEGLGVTLTTSVDFLK